MNGIFLIPLYTVIFILLILCISLYFMIIYLLNKTQRMEERINKFFLYLVKNEGSLPDDIHPVSKDIRGV